MQSAGAMLVFLTLVDRRQADFCHRRRNERQRSRESGPELADALESTWSLDRGTCDAPPLRGDHSRREGLAGGEHCLDAVREVKECRVSLR